MRQTSPLSNPQGGSSHFRLNCPPKLHPNTRPAQHRSAGTSIQGGHADRGHPRHHTVPRLGGGMLPVGPHLGGRAVVAGACQPVQGTFGRVFLRIVNILSVIPVPGSQCPAVDSHPARPRSATPTTVGNNLENRRSQLCIPARFFQSLLPGRNTGRIA